MAAFFLHVTSGEISTFAATNKTMLQVQAATNDRIRVSGWTASFKGTSATDAPVIVQLLRQSTSGTGLQTGSGAISKNNLDDSPTIQSTFLAGLVAAAANTAEPTSGDILDTQEVHPQTGVRVFYPSGQEKILSNGQRLGIRVLDAASHLCVIDMDIEE